MSKPYKILYSLQSSAEGWAKEEIPKSHGGCTSAVMISIMGTPGNGEALSIRVLSKDGNTDKELTPSQLYITWMMYTAHLIRVLDADSAAHWIVTKAMELVRAVMDGTKDSPPSPDSN